VLDPADAAIVYGLAVFSVQRKDLKRATELAAELSRLDPSDPRLRQLVAAIEAQR
jgi:Flp pilus assembly protein TadD